MRYLLLICLKEEKSGAGKFANNIAEQYAPEYPVEEVCRALMD